MPYVLESKVGFRFISTPYLTPWLGPWIRHESGKQYDTIARENRILQELIDQLPHHHYFQQFWDPSFMNWLSFYWNGFSSSLYCTYRLKGIRTKPVELEDLRPNIRTYVRKAGNRFGLRLRDNPSISDFISLNNQTFQRQGKAVPYSDDLILRLDAACEERNARKIFIAEDQRGEMHAGVYIVWDSECAYLLMSGGNPNLRSSGATSLCVYEAILFAATISDNFDFEGSMLENVEVFFRGFGGVQVPYISITRTNSKVLKLINFLKQMATR